MKRQFTDLLYIFLAVLMALGTIAVTRPDTASAKRSLDAVGLHNIRILSLIMPCRLSGSFYFYGVFFDAYIAPAQETNTACFNIRDKSWTIAEPFKGS